jgi:hypothetical protein
MSVRFFYVDESFDENKFCLCALGIRHIDWEPAFQAVKQHRIALKKDFGIPLRREIHAHDLVSGHGRLAERTIGKWQRSQIFFGLLKLASQLPNAMLFNICVPVKGDKDPQMTAWDRLTNRIERTMRFLEEKESKVRRALVDSYRGQSK